MGCSLFAWEISVGKVRLKLIKFLPKGVSMLKVLSLTTLLGTAAMAAAPAEKGNFTAAQKEEINKSIKEYLKNNPQELIKVIQDFSVQQQKEAFEKVQANIGAAKGELTDPKNAIVMGKADAAVKLVLFVDPNCPHCRIFEATLGEIEKELSEKDNLCVMIRQWPILGDASKAVAAGLIAANAQDSKKFQVLSEKIIKSDKKWDAEQFLAAAKEAGYDVEKIKAALGGEAVLAQLKNTAELATKIGLDATPTLILADKKGARLVQVPDKDSLKKILVEAVKAA